MILQETWGSGLGLSPELSVNCAFFAVVTTELFCADKVLLAAYFALLLPSDTVSCAVATMGAPAQVLVNLIGLKP